MDKAVNIDVGSSKSLVNRALIVKSLLENFEIEYHSKCEDVQSLQNALEGLDRGESSFELKEGGTSFRFFLTRVSLLERPVSIKASQRLLSRPHEELYKVLRDLGVEVHEKKNEIIVQGPWKYSTGITVDCSKSTQYASSLMLAMLGLGQPAKLFIRNLTHSVPYFHMTVNLLDKLGLGYFDSSSATVFVDGGGLKCKEKFVVEADWSSATSIAALSVHSKMVTISGLDRDSSQPDCRVLELFDHMKISHKFNGNNWIICPTNQYQGLKVDLKDSPDLFPVLAALCSFATSESCFYGLENLVFKESNRIENTKYLLEAIGVEVEHYPDRFQIVKPLSKSSLNSISQIDFCPDSDHRMAMAAAVVQMAGAWVTIKDLKVVDKSFPGFWDAMRRLM